MNLLTPESILLITLHIIGLRGKKNVHLGFSITSYRKTQINFLANPIFGLKIGKESRIWCVCVGGG